MITRRFAPVEPVLGNLRGNKGLDRFTLPGRSKVDGQWKLYRLIHSIEKLVHHGYGVCAQLEANAAGAGRLVFETAELALLDDLEAARAAISGAYAVPAPVSATAPPPWAICAA